MPAAAADSLIPAAMRAAQWSWSRLQTGCCRSRRLHGWHEGGSTARVLRRAPQTPCRSAHPVRRHVLEEGGGRLGVVEQVHDAGRRPVETSRIDHASPRSATVGWRRYAALGTDVVHQVRRTAAGWCGSIVKRPCLAPPSRAKAMPGPDPPHHAKPRREVFSRRTQSSSGGPQLGHLLDVEPPVEAGLLRPPVAEPDAAAARGQPRRQLVAVHQLRVDIGDADD